MKKSLVIVESPAKAKTISKYLGDAFEVRASVGHIIDLPKKKLGVDVAHDFKTDYEVIPGKEKVVHELERAAKRADTVFLAADPDREGEAICQHLHDVVARENPRVFRVLFHEITREAVRKAFEHPGEIDRNLVQAQNTRRILDRLVGYKISPLLWQKVKRGLSAGRVQTVALRLIVDREREIRAFVSEEYWTFTAHLKAAKPPTFKARAVKLDGKKFKVANGEDAAALKAELEAAPFLVESVQKTLKKQQPRPPFITSKLQQEANRKFRFTARKTMQVAQKLYEGIEYGSEGSVGLITYMRTDSTRIAPSALEAVRGHILETYGKEYLPGKARLFQKSEGAQDAHEAIRPTDVRRTPEAVRPFLDSDQYKLYTLIWQRFVASQMEAAVFDHTDIKVAAGRCLFQATGDVLRFPGFLKVYKEVAEEGEQGPDGAAEGMLPPVEPKELLKLLELATLQQFTQPPQRYTEATLIKALEEKGIGRPSTYAQIVNVIQDREYVNKDEGKFSPSETGEIVIDLVTESFATLFNYDYTAGMEKDLDLIEQGKKNWLEELKTFYADFSKTLKKAEKEMKNLRQVVEETEETCDKCGASMQIRWGRFGRFLSCSRYPECKSARDLPNGKPTAAPAPAAAGEGEGAAEACDKCGAPMVLKKGRFGEFLSCSAYPECRNTRKIVKGKARPVVEPKVLDEACPVCGKPLAEKQGRYGTFVSCTGYPKCTYVKREMLGMKCPRPGCTGEIVVNRRGRGKVFYGCSNYPKCDFTSWTKPVAVACRECGSPYLVEKPSKKEGTILSCPAKGCRHHEKAPVPAGRPDPGEREPEKQSPSAREEP
ncbi:MAG: type I DNA topoisomerase [Acidobacteria bacterium]|nr:type I DNA topoisomerase [Acidobacteriota bacterium]